MRTELRWVLALALLLGCRYQNQPPSGQQRCASAGTHPRCPAGYVCAGDERCWREGEAPAPGRAFGGLVPAGGTAASERYLMRTTLGPAPAARSERYQLAGARVVRAR